MRKKTIITSFILLIFSELTNGQVIWNKKANYPDKRWGASGFSINGKGYIGLGYSPYIKRDLWEYDTALNSWTQKADFPGAERGEAVAFSIGNYAYVGTGNISKPSEDFYKYNPITNKWSPVANFGGGIRTAASSFVIGNYGYVGLGAPLINDFWKYDPSLDLWTKIANFPSTYRTGSSGFSISNKGYIVLGYDQKNNKETNELWEYDPSLNSWSQKSNFPGRKRRHAGAFVVCGKAYVGGGLDSATHSLNDFWEYDNVKDTWTQIPSLPDSTRGLFPTFTIGNKGYLGTGYYQANPTNVYYLTSLWEFKLALPCKTSDIKENNVENVIAIFPNPFTNKINIQTLNYQSLEIVLFDITSRRIFAQEFTNSVSLNTELLPKGVYIYEIKSIKGILQKGKVIKN